MNSTTTNAYPRSVHEKYLGVVQLARTIDKAKMVANGTIGEYIYDCPMDQALFAEFGIDGKKLSAIASDVAKNTTHLPNIEAYVKPLVQQKTPLDHKGPFYRMDLMTPEFSPAPLDVPPLPPPPPQPANSHWRPRMW